MILQMISAHCGVLKILKGMDKNMKVCFIGIGSIGKRHIRNLKQLLGKDVEIHAYRHHGGENLSEDIAALVDKEIFNQEDIIEKYDAVFVTNPTVMHFETIKQWWNKTNHFFVEKPVYDSLKYDDAMLDEDKIYVACPLRYSSVYQYINKYLEDKDVISARAVSSSYLPDWRPDQDYRKVYSAKKELGGGVNIDLIHEWDYVVDLFGFPESTNICSGKYSSLDITSNDLSVGIACYTNKLVEVHLDYFGRRAVRTLELYLDDDKILVDYINYTVTFEKNHRVVSLEEDANDKYMKEMEYYLQLLEGKSENVNNLSKARAILKIAIGGGK